MKNSIIIIFLLLNLIKYTFAQDFWEPLPSSPLRCPFTSIKVNDNGDIFTVNPGEGVYRSTDNGNSWANVLVHNSLDYISINPKGDIYVRDLNGVDFERYFFSTDNGDTWNPIYDTVLTGKLYFSSNNYFFTSKDYAIYRSKDEGVTWKQTFKLKSYLNVFTITGNDKIFQQSYGDKTIYYSQDYGDTWKNISSPQSNIYSINVSQDNSILVGSNNVLFKSVDDGSTWQNALTITNKEWMNFPCIYIDNKGKIYASAFPLWGSNFGDLYQSNDNGNTWSLTGLTNRNISSIAVDKNGYVFTANSDNYSFSSYGDGIFRSENNGESWEQLHNGLSPLQISALAITNNKIFAGTNRGLFISTDSGESWIQPYRDINHGIDYSFETNNMIRQIWISKNKEVFIINGTGLLKSIDGGMEWQVIYSDEVHSIKKIWIDAQDNIFMLLATGGMKYSTNAGKTWNDILSYDPNSSMVIQDFAINSLDHIFLSVKDRIYNGVFRSFDFGATEFAQTNMKSERTEKIVIDSKGKIYITLRSVRDETKGEEINSEVYFSTDEGDTWQWFSDYLTTTSVSAFAINQNDRVFIGSYDGVFIFNENNNRWEKTNSGLPDFTIPYFYAYISCFGFDDAGYAYLGTANAWLEHPTYGIFKSKNKILTGIKNQELLSYKVFSLSQNYPNPFNPTTTIRYQIPHAGFVSLKIYDVLGKETAALVNEEKPAGEYNVTFDGSNLSSGVYFYQLKSGSFVETKKLILMK